MPDDIGVALAGFVNTVSEFALLIQRRSCGYGRSVYYTPNGFGLYTSPQNIKCPINLSLDNAALCLEKRNRKRCQNES